VANATPQIQAAKAHRKDTRRELVRAEDRLDEFQVRRQRGEENLGVAIDRIHETIARRKEDWKAAKAAVDKLQEAKQHTLAGIQLDRNDGHSGIATFFYDFVDDFMERRGLHPGSRVRSASHNAAVGGSPSSDHLDAPNRFATDYPTYRGLDDAQALARALGITNWQPNSYASHIIEVDGVRLVLQILWGAAIDHADHVHVGAHLA
jgi:hypothetical protein